MCSILCLGLKMDNRKLQTPQFWKGLQAFQFLLDARWIVLACCVLEGHLEASALCTCPGVLHFLPLYCQNCPWNRMSSFVFLSSHCQLQPDSLNGHITLCSRFLVFFCTWCPAAGIPYLVQPQFLFIQTQTCKDLVPYSSFASSWTTSGSSLCFTFYSLGLTPYLSILKGLRCLNSGENSLQLSEAHVMLLNIYAFIPA